MENPFKGYENRRHQTRQSEARTFSNLRGQLSNAPKYISKAHAVCKFFNINASSAAYEVDHQTVAFALDNSTTVITGDRDLLAYGGAESPALEEITLSKIG